MSDRSRKRTPMKGQEEPRARAGDRRSFEVESLLPSGEGVSGRTRIAGAFPGEQVVARVEHVGKHASFATILEVERGRAGRRLPPCPRHVDLKDGSCTGCGLMALDESGQRALLREMLLAQDGLDVGEVVAAPESLGYRWSAKRIAFGGPGKLRLGSFMRGTNRPADMEGCLVDHPLIAAAADELAEAARDLGIAAHDEERRRLGLRAVWLRTDGTEVLATLVTSEANEDGCGGLARGSRAAMAWRSAFIVSAAMRSGARRRRCLRNRCARGEWHADRSARLSATQSQGRRADV